MPTHQSRLVGWLWAALVAATILVPGPSVRAQALEPRSYVNAPVGINFLLLYRGGRTARTGRCRGSDPRRKGVLRTGVPSTGPLSRLRATCARNLRTDISIAAPR